MLEVNRLESEGEFKFTQLPNSWEERGSRKGIEQEREAVALKMLEEGLSIDVIAKVTDWEKGASEKLTELKNEGKTTELGY